MTDRHWWDEMAEKATADGHAAFTVDWYARVAELHAERFPTADERTRRNLAELIEVAS